MQAACGESKGKSFFDLLLMTHVLCNSKVMLVMGIIVLVGKVAQEICDKLFPLLELLSSYLCGCWARESLH